MPLDVATVHVPTHMRRCATRCICVRGDREKRARGDDAESSVCRTSMPAVIDVEDCVARVASTVTAVSDEPKLAWALLVRGVELSPEGWFSFAHGIIALFAACDPEASRFPALAAIDLEGCRSLCDGGLLAFGSALKKAPPHVPRSLRMWFAASTGISNTGLHGWAAMIDGKVELVSVGLTNNELVDSEGASGSLELLLSTQSQLETVHANHVGLSDHTWHRLEPIVARHTHLKRFFAKQNEKVSAAVKAAGAATRVVW